MVSDGELVARLREILRTSDLETTTTSAVRRRLEQEFGVDLYERRAFIREQVDIFLDTHVAAQTQSQEDGVEEQDEIEDKEEEEKDVENSEDENGSEGSHQQDGGGPEEEDEEEEGESEEDDKRSKKKRPGKVEKEASRKGGGFSKPCALSPQLQELVGEPELARTEVVKRIWAYIRDKDLQNPKDKRKILCDETLRGIFRVSTIDMFQMNKALSKHIWPLDEEEAAPVKSSQKEKPNKRGREATPVKSSQKPKQHKRGREDEPKQKEKKKKAGVSGFLAPLPMSDALVNFFGTGEIELSRADVVKRMWKYIKENELQDPSDKRRIVCDNKLKELFNVESFTGFTVSKLLTAHFIKRDDD